MVMHNLVLVNSRNVNIPSYLLDVGDKVEIKPKEKTRKAVKESMELVKDRPVPKWLKRDKTACSGDIIQLPSRDDIGFAINENLIVELYSK